MASQRTIALELQADWLPEAVEYFGPQPGLTVHVFSITVRVHGSRQNWDRQTFFLQVAE